MFWVIGLHLVMMYHFGSSWLSCYVALFVFNGAVMGFFHGPLFWHAIHCHHIAGVRFLLHLVILFFMEHFQHFFCTGRSWGVDAPASGGGPAPFSVYFH